MPTQAQLDEVAEIVADLDPERAAIVQAHAGWALLLQNAEKNRGEQ